MLVFDNWVLFSYDLFPSIKLTPYMTKICLLLCFVKFHKTSRQSFRLILMCSSLFWFRSGICFFPWLHEREHTQWNLHSFFSEPWKVPAFSCSVTKGAVNFYCSGIIKHSVVFTWPFVSFYLNIILIMFSIYVNKELKNSN